ncbi:hypothetical protein HQQ80_14085 [Microbacteriaceae bacterium VKM Ac-2855]|nr:hypothetical protein [Microbacteriaceae bacterium VKM Ac-2855]
MDTSTLSSRIAAFAAAVRAGVESVDWARLTETQLIEACVALGELERAAAGGAVAVAGVIEAASGRERGMDALASTHGQRTGKALLAMLTGCSEATAGRRIRLAQGVFAGVGMLGQDIPAVFPAVGQAVREGRLHPDAAEALVSTLGPSVARIHPDELAVAEASILAAATDPDGEAATSGGLTVIGIAADLVKIQALAWKARLDPDGLEPTEEEAFEKRNGIWRRGKNGLETLVLTLTTEQAAAVKASLSPHTSPRKPRFTDADCDAAENGEVDDAAIFTDTRTSGQKTADAAVSLIVAGGASESPVGATPQITAYIHADDLTDENATGPAYLDHVEEPVPAATVRRLRCFGEIRIAITGSHAQTDALGQPARDFTMKQKRLLAARDGGCAWTGCTAPPAWTEAHHVTWWSRGGQTSVDNGILLCSFHHHVIHGKAGWRIHMLPTLDGPRPHLIAPLHIDPRQTPRRMGNQRATIAGITRHRPPGSEPDSPPPVSETRSNIPTPTSESNPTLWGQASRRRETDPPPNA